MRTNSAHLSLVMRRPSFTVDSASKNVTAGAAQDGGPKSAAGAVGANIDVAGIGGDVGESIAGSSPVSQPPGRRTSRRAGGEPGRRRGGCGSGGHANGPGLPAAATAARRLARLRRHRRERTAAAACRRRPPGPNVQPEPAAPILTKPASAAMSANPSPSRRSIAGPAIHRRSTTAGPENVNPLRTRTL